MLAIIRIRGSVRLNPDIKVALKLLKLESANHCVVIPQNGSMLGMVEQVKDYVTYGPIAEGTLTQLIEKRGKSAGNKKLDAAFYTAHKVKDAAALAKALMSGQKAEDFGLKGVFRLRPPSKGFERGGIKKPYALGGVLGDRKQAINKLLASMM